MKQPPRPANEDDRLQALRQLLILDTPPEERFDRLTAFAAEEFDMPIVLLSLIDAERQWFQSVLCPFTGPRWALGPVIARRGP